jgi:hypothetical protein
MTLNARQEALEVLTELAALAPEVRLGQLMAHLGFLGEDQLERSLWDIDDDELLAVLHRHHALARQTRQTSHYTRPAGHESRLSLLFLRHVLRGWLLPAVAPAFVQVIQEVVPLIACAA